MNVTTALWEPWLEVVLAIHGFCQSSVETEDSQGTEHPLPPVWTPFQIDQKDLEQEKSNTTVRLNGAPKPGKCLFSS